MRILIHYPWLLVLLLLAGCFLFTTGRGRGGGGRGGGSRGGGSRGGSSRYPSSSGRESKPPSYPSHPSPPKPEAPKPKPPAIKPPPPRPSAPKEPDVVRQPASNPNFREPGSNQGSSQNQPPYNPNYPQQPPPYSPGGPPPPYSPGRPPPPYSPAGQPPPHVPGGPPPPYNPNQPNAPLGPPPPYPGGQPYPQQPGMGSAPYPRQPGMGPAPYPQQPGMGPAPYPQQPGMGPSPYPRQPGMGPAPYPQQPGMGPSSYPRQPGMGPAPYPQQPGMGPSPYPRQPGMHYPQQPGMGRPYPQQPLGGNTWTPQSGMPAPAYMNYGGLPTGTNMYVKPHKKKGFLGSLMSMGKGGTPKPGKNKYYGSYPSPYGVHGMGGGGMGGGFMGKHSSAAMYTILPYMAARQATNLFRPRFGFMPIFLPYPHYHHHYHGYNDYDSTYYNVYNNDYVGRCNRPIKPQNAEIQCNATYREVKCNVNCTEGYSYSDNSTIKRNLCWHATGVWRPTKNLPGCKPVCNETCLNGGSCIRPGVCGCQPDYRGTHCQFHFLNCDVRKLAGDNKISWVCRHTKNETSCKVHCRPPAEFESPSAESYKCSPDGVWTPISMPQCIVKSESKNETVNAA